MTARGRPRPGIGPGLQAPVAALEWVGGIGGRISMVDQTLLPLRFVRRWIGDVETLWWAIRRLVVRGAPAIGVAAAYGVLLGARSARRRTARAIRAAGLEAARYLATSRPTAVNLFWAIERMSARLSLLTRDSPGKDTPPRARRILENLLAEARAIQDEDRVLCDAIGRHGARLLRSGWTVLTHCNAGSLATGGSGTALSVVYAAKAAGKRIRVFADETRPLLQGARLTSWELAQAGVDVTLICDNAAASVMAAGKVDCVVVGADRIAANGDVANKIGTYGVAVLAKQHGIPFYVAAPSTTFDLAIRVGREIPIEERAGEEVSEGFGRRTAPGGVRVFNPAFDVTPAGLVTAIITEKGVLRPPYRRSVARAMAQSSRGARLLT